MKVPYYCPYCNERSTRRWNLEVHIKRKHGGSPGQYLASDPFYKRSVQSDQFGSATIADITGEGDCRLPTYHHGSTNAAMDIALFRWSNVSTL